MYAGVRHELSTFPLRLRDMCLSTITRSTFFQTFARAVILIVTKAINLVDSHRYMLWSYWLNANATSSMLR